MDTIEVGHTELILHCDGKRQTSKELKKPENMRENNVVIT